MITTAAWISLAIGILLTFVAGGGFIGLIGWPIGIFLLLCSFSSIPTLLLYLVCSVFSIQLDYGQMIIFTAFSSLFVLGIAIYLGTKYSAKPLPGKAPASTLEIAGWSSFFLALVGLLFWFILLISHFGFHSKFPTTYLTWLQVEGQKDE